MSAAVAAPGRLGGRPAPRLGCAQTIAGYIRHSPRRARGVPASPVGASAQASRTAVGRGMSGGVLRAGSPPAGFAQGRGVVLRGPVVDAASLAPRHLVEAGAPVGAPPFGVGDLPAQTAQFDVVWACPGRPESRARPSPRRALDEVDLVALDDDDGLGTRSDLKCDHCGLTCVHGFAPTAPGAYRAQDPERLRVCAGHRPGAVRHQDCRCVRIIASTCAPSRIRTCAHGSGGRTLRQR